ncbi:MAG: ATP-binding protein [Oligoflexus sp.]|nr:ATP-binding protein [Oligoflexus sp.]
MTADFVFEIVNRRYEKGSIIIATNLAFKEWGQIFPGVPCVTAMIDRLTHHARIIKVGGDSYRLRESRRGKAKAVSSKKATFAVALYRAPEIRSKQLQIFSYDSCCLPPTVDLKLRVQHAPLGSMFITSQSED